MRMEQNQQLSFADVEYAHKGKVTRRQKFLAQFEALLPWRACGQWSNHITPPAKAAGANRLPWIPCCMCSSRRLSTTTPPPARRPIRDWIAAVLLRDSSRTGAGLKHDFAVSALTGTARLNRTNLPDHQPNAERVGPVFKSRYHPPMPAWLPRRPRPKTKVNHAPPKWIPAKKQSMVFR